jgi:LPS sulfotransferase NodH
MLQPDSDFLDEAYDQPPHDGARRLLFICTTPRSGSHRLGRALFELGLGIPSEYFHANTICTLGDRWGLNGDRKSAPWLDRYWQQVQRRRARGGFVAASIFGTQTHLLKRLATPGDQPVFVHLYRRSAADQIASLLALYQTKMPYENQRQMPNIPSISEISPRSIRVLDQWLDLQNRKWRTLLDGKPHLAIASEDFFADPAKILGAILEQGEFEITPSELESAADHVRRSKAYSVSAGIKRQLLLEHAASFALLDRGGG